MIIAISAVVLVVLILLIASATLLNVDKYRPRIQAELASKLGRPVTLGTLHLHLLPLSIRMDGLSIGESPAFPSSRPFATAQQVFVSAGLFSLIHGEPNINDLTLKSPQIELIRNAAGIWNFSDLGNSSKSNSKPNASSSQSQLSLNKLKITDGQVAVTDQRTKAPRTVYNHLDVTLSGFAPGKQFDLDAALHFPGSGKELLSFKGKAGPLSSASAGATPIDGHLSLQEISLAALNSITAGSIPPNTDASISGDATVNSDNENIHCKGTLDLTNATVRGAKVNYPVNAQYDLALNRKTDQITISSGSVKMGPTAVALSGTVDSGVTPSTLNVRLGTQNASITELSRLASLFGVAFNTNDQIKGSISADLTVTGNMKNPQVQGNLSASTIQAQGLALTNVRATSSMNNGVVTLSPVTAGAFGGQADGTITVDTRAAHPLCTVKNAKLSGVDVNALLSAISTAKDTLYGRLAADANLSFAVDAGNNVARTLNGVLNFNVTDGHLKNVNIMNELSKVGKFLGSAPAQAGSGTTIQKFAGTMNITNGVANSNNLVAVLPEGSLSGTGSLNLVSEALNLRVNAVLNSGISKTVGGTGIGGFMNTALANKQGELVIPVVVTGTMAHPTFTPDVQALAKMKVSNLLPTSGNPASLVSGVLGSVLGGTKGQSANQNNGQQQNPLGGLLQQLGKKKP